MSTDGPKVNLTFLEILQEKQKDAGMKELIFIGTCGLHTIHHGFQHGKNSSQWNLKKVLSAMFKIFGESSSRRADYKKIPVAESNDYPLQFCAHYWVEDKIVVKRAQKAWSEVTEVVKYWESRQKSKQSFFAHKLNKFLTRFQTEALMVHFWLIQLKKS